MRVSADAMAMTVTASAPSPMARTMRGSNTSRPSEAIAKVTPENTTVRPAVSAVRRIAARRPSRPGMPAARCSSRNRLTISRP